MYILHSLLLGTVPFVHPFTLSLASLTFTEEGDMRDCLPLLWVEYDEEEEGKYPLYPLLLYAFAAAISLSTSIVGPSFRESFRLEYFATVGDITLDTRLQ